MSKETFSTDGENRINHTDLKIRYEKSVNESKVSGLRTIIGSMPCCGNEMLFHTPEQCEAAFESSMFCVHCQSHVFKKISFHKAHITKIIPR